ncbi:hypothetical protein RB594_001633 [Gaeumannomyces avenae]
MKDFDAKYGNWPRRLLHVPTLTSHEWRPGHRYGGHERPAYNTLSYTWGRYALKEGEQPAVKALPIRIQGRRTWKIPRINPAHFSVEEFHAAVKLATAAFSPLDLDNRWIERRHMDPELVVDFLWLDVACIDQEHAKTKLAEINRQAAIFQNSRTSCVWLGHLGHGQLLEIQDFCRERGWSQLSVNNQTNKEQQHLEWVKQRLPRVEEIVDLVLLNKQESDDKDAARTMAPWFSSLWTLQEAYLRPHSCLLPRGCLDMLDGPAAGSSQRMLTLRDLNMALLSAVTLCNECVALDVGPRDRLGAIADKVYEAGLRELYNKSPFAIFAASSRRQAWDPCDRVYGIMQIFGIQLPLRRRGDGKSCTPAELRQMLSEKLLLAYPVETQLFVHTEPPRDPMSKWRIGSSAALPRWANDLVGPARSSERAHWERPHPARPLPLCRFSVTHGSAYFQGRLCALNDLLVSFETFDAVRPLDHETTSERVEESMGNVDVTFDMIPSTLPGGSRLQIPGITGFLFADINYHYNDVHNILAKMATNSKDTDGGDVQVLLLGSCLDPLLASYLKQEGAACEEFGAAWREEHDEWFVGLILRKKPHHSGQEPGRRPTGPCSPFVPSYERIGVCKWFKADRWVREEGDEKVEVGFERLTDDMKTLLSGRGDRWCEAEGYWG